MKDAPGVSVTVLDFGDGRAIDASLDVVGKGPFIRMVYLGRPQVVTTVQR